MKLLDAIAATILLVAALMLTGVIDETYLLLSVGLIATPVDLTRETVERIVEAVLHRDWKTISEVSAPLLRVLLITYVLRTVVYVAAAGIVLLWAVPFFRRAFDSLKQRDFEDDTGGTPTDKARIIAALRSRAARKRVESYAFLLAALVSLAVAIGFVTQESYSQRPEALDTDATATETALSRAENLISDAQVSSRDRRDDARQHEDDLLELVRDQLAGIDDARPVELAKSSQAILAALLARQPSPASPELSEAAAVAREYVSFARAQLDVINRQAEIEVIQRTVLAVVIKLAALILILALARTLVRLYQQGFDLAIQYEAIADAVLIGPATMPSDFTRLRELFTPAIRDNVSVRMPRSMANALAQLLDAREGRAVRKPDGDAANT